MKTILKKIARIAIMIWFTVSFAALCIYDPTPWQAVIVVANFAAAAIVLGRCPINDSDRA